MIHKIATQCMSKIFDIEIFDAEKANEGMNVIINCPHKKIKSGYYVLWQIINPYPSMSVNRNNYYLLYVGEYELSVDVYNSFCSVPAEIHEGRGGGHVRFRLFVKSVCESLSFDMEDTHMSACIVLYDMIRKNENVNKNSKIWIYGIAYLFEDKHIDDMETYIDTVSSFKIYKPKNRLVIYDKERTAEYNFRYSR